MDIMFENKIRMFNLEFKGLTKEILFRIESSLKIIITVNAEFIVIANENERFKHIIKNNFSTFDGQIPYLLAKLKHRNTHFEKISGSDLIYDICEYSKANGYRIFLLGGHEEINNKASEILRRKYYIEIGGFSPEHRPYPFERAHNENILEKILDFKPHFLLVAFGPPKQEFWLDDNKRYLEEIGVKWAVGVGGTFEMVAGRVTRAPKMIQNMGCESVWRLYQDPKRLKRFLKIFKMLKYIK